MKIRTLFSKAKTEAEMSEEMRQHVERQTEQHLAEGMAPDEARYLALRKFGNVASIQEQARGQRGGVWLELTIKEVGFAIRSLRRSIGFSLAVLTTLALCIGPNTAILSVLYALVYKPLPFHEPERLVAIANVAERAGGSRRQASVEQYRDFKAQADRFDGFTYFDSKRVIIGEEDSPVRVTGFEVSADFFSVLGLQPQLGRAFTPDEQTPGKEHVVMLSSAAWKKRYNGDPGIIGREILMDSQAFTIIGVAPACFEEVFTDLEFLRPYVVGSESIDSQARYTGAVTLLGRLKPKVAVAAGRAQLEVLEKAFYDQTASPRLRGFLDAGGYHLTVNDARQALADPVKTPLLLLQGGAALVLLIGCVNVASLLLARANAKRPELAVRHALGAGLGTLLRQMLGESFLLVGLAGASGIGIASALLRVMNHYLPAIVRHVPPVELNPQVLGIVLVVVVVIVLAMGVVPFAMLWRSGLRVGENTMASSVSRRGRNAISALVIAQMAIALVLLIGAGLLIHSFARVMAVKPGFDAEQVVQGGVSLPKLRYKNPGDRVGVQQRIFAAMKEIPGVEAAGLTSSPGVADRFATTPFLLRGSDPTTTDKAQALLYVNTVSPEYFATMGIRLLDGRGFRDDDELTRNPVAIVDQTFVDRYFPGQDVLGRELSLGTNAPPEGRPWIRIIGVAARANLTGLEARDGWPFVYLPFNQQPSLSFTVLIRSPRLASDMVNEMRTRVHAIDPGLPLFSTGTLAMGLDSLVGNRRALMWLLALLAALALALAAVGLYGVLNYDVSQRTREIGIRGAIGATRGQIVTMILRQGLWKAGLGLVAGLVGAFFFARILRKMLFDVSATDPVAYGVVAALLLLVALAASWLPARRAAKVDPVVALRAE